MSRNLVIRPHEERKKEVRIGKTFAEYFTIGLIGAFGLIMCIIMLVIIIASPIFLQYSDFERNDFFTAEVHGNSMYPTIEDGDYVLVVKTYNISVNDIIVFFDEDTGKYIAHRVVSIEDNTILTKGDNNNFYDDEITKREIIGKVIKIMNNKLDLWCHEAYIKALNWW